MTKNFLQWNSKKIALDSDRKRPFFDEIDAKRLQYRLDVMKKENFQELKKRLSQLLT